MGPPFWRKGGGSHRLAMLPFERVMVVSYRLSIVTIALSLTIRPQSGCNLDVTESQINRVTYFGHFGTKFGEEGVDGDRCKPCHNLEERWGCQSYAKEIVPFEHNT